VLKPKEEHYKMYREIIAMITPVLLFSACTSVTTVQGNRNPDLGGGKVLLYSTGGKYLDTANVGNLPDMVTFTPDGRTLLSANEGEPANDYSSDPPGSVSIIRLQGSTGGKVEQVITLTFDNVTIPTDLRIKPGSTPGLDIEPEYITINDMGTRAWVALQENNGLAIIDIDEEKIHSIVSLGRKDFQMIDLNSKDGANVMAVPANVYGLYQPDTIASYSVNGEQYVVSANEGDDREYDAWEDYAKAYKLQEKGDSFSQGLQNEILTVEGRKKLRILKDLGKDGDGTYTELYLAGTRSFSIWSATGELVYDSGAEFEQELAAHYPQNFNTRVDDTDDKEDMKELAADGIPYEMVGDTAYFWEGVDARSHKKGCEPEALALAKIDGRVFAYIGLEKQGGFFTYDITEPHKSRMVAYHNDIDYSALPSASGDLAPEGMVSFQQEGKHYLAIANEMSSSVAIYGLQNNGKAQKLASLIIGTFGSGAAEIIAYDPAAKQLFVTNGETKSVTILDISKPSSPVQSGNIDFSEYGNSVQSVAVKNGLVAIAVE
jgi:DNA-binding beta-propeller fold protein YncE